MTSGNDINQAKATYSGFTSIIKWGAILAVAAAALVIVLISN